MSCRFFSFIPPKAKIGLEHDLQAFSRFFNPKIFALIWLFVAKIGDRKKTSKAEFLRDSNEWQERDIIGA